MSLENPKVDDQYLRYAELLIEQHHLLCRGASDDDLEAIEDQMTTLWDALDAAQRQSLSGLGSDMNWLRRGGKHAPKASSAQQAADGELRELYEARDRGDWHRVLSSSERSGVRPSSRQTGRLQCLAISVSRGGK